MPSNLYGPGDNYHPEQQPCAAALIRRFLMKRRRRREGCHALGQRHPPREFLFVDDLAEARCSLPKNYSGEPHLNVGAGTDVTIAEGCGLIAKVVVLAGALEYDRTKPDGTPRKLMDVSKLAELGWRAKTSLEGRPPRNLCRFPARGGRNR